MRRVVKFNRMRARATLKWTGLAEDTTNRKMRWSRELLEHISKFKAVFHNRPIRISKRPLLEWRIANISCKNVSFASMQSWTSRTAVCCPVSIYFTGTALTTGLWKLRAVLCATRRLRTKTTSKLIFWSMKCSKSVSITNTSTRTTSSCANQRFYSLINTDKSFSLQCHTNMTFWIIR